MEESLPPTVIEDIAEYLRLFSPQFDGFFDQSPDGCHHIDFSCCKDFERVCYQLDKTEEARAWYQNKSMRSYRERTGN